MITGASSGVGRAAALAFAREGARLVLSARARAPLDAVAAECRALGADARVVECDVSRAPTVEAVAAAAAGAFGGIDVWVHTAAVMAYGKFEEVPADVFDQVVTTDLLGSANVARVALARFRARGSGVLILTGSLLGEVVTPYMSSYVTSKWGMRALARALRLETRDAPDIHVCVVSPGAVDTPIYRTAANYAGRFGQPPPPVDPPEKMARAIVRCARRPRATMSVGAANRIVGLGFLLMPPLYDVLVGPLMRAGGLSRETVEPHAGNVFAPAAPPSGSVRDTRTRSWKPAAAAAAVAGTAVAGALLARRPGTQG